MKCEFCDSTVALQMDLSMNPISKNYVYCSSCYGKYIKGFIVFFDGKYLYRIPSKQSKMVRVDSARETAMKHLSCEEREQLSNILGKISAITDLEKTIVKVRQELGETFETTKDKFLTDKVICYG